MGEVKILLAEDEAELAKALRTILEHSNYQVDVVDNGQTAVEKANTNYYDGMIFDIMMPIMDGITALEQIRQLGIMTPALMLTAKTTSEDCIAGLDAGADDYITKPFVMTELLARVRALVRRSKMHTADKLEYGNICLKRDTMELSQKEVSMRLSSYEFIIMELLMRNKNKPISISQLTERIKKQETAEEYLITVYISYLVNKLKMLDANILIEEESGNYRLVEGN